MPGTPGARTGLASILAVDPATAYRTTINAIRDWLESNATLTASGLLADRPTSTPGTPGITGRKYYATDTAVEYRDTGTGWVALGVELVTTLPASPYNGQVIDYLADATKGVVWRLRYRAASASAYKWEVVGGSELTAERPAGTFDVITATSYAALGNAVQVTVPLAGDYLLGWGGSIGQGTQDVSGFLAIKLGAAATSDNDAIPHQQRSATTSQNPLLPAARRVRRDGLSAGSVIAVQARVTGGAMTTDKNFLNARPVRVG